eukprot:1176865-Prorocentrum_minimum.AAC.3
MFSILNRHKRDKPPISLSRKLVIRPKNASGHSHNDNCQVICKPTTKLQDGATPSPANDPAESDRTQYPPEYSKIERKVPTSRLSEKPSSVKPT